MPEPAAPIKPNPIDADAVLAWYDRHARLMPWRVAPADKVAGERPDPYRVWLSEVMLQQTTVVTVRRYFEDFTRRWPTVADLAAAPREEVLAAWVGLGYYARARNLHACAQAVVADHGGAFPTSAEGLKTLPGIGAYTSAAIAAICFDEQIGVVDGNVERVVARLIRLPEPVRNAKPLIGGIVGEAVPQRAGDFAQAMMDLGATICAPKSANCLVCPLRPGCASAAAGDALDFPVAPPKKKRPARVGHAYVLERPDGAIWLRRRADKGMLAEMTEVPGSAWTDELETPEFPVDTEWREAGEVEHVFTHFSLRLTVWQGRAGEEPPGQGWWSQPGALAREALPTLYRKVLKSAGIEVRPQRG